MRQSAGMYTWIRQAPSLDELDYLGVTDTLLP